MPYEIATYNRIHAVKYAHKWAYKRNPTYYNYESIGGDCTNFASQCIYAGSGIMNYTGITGWYYRNANDKAPAWTGVSFLRNFLVHNHDRPGPFGREVPMEEILPGDIIQLSFDGITYQHSPVVVEIGKVPKPENIRIAAHSFDSDYRLLNTYQYKTLRCLQISGIRK